MEEKRLICHKKNFSWGERRGVGSMSKIITMATGSIMVSLVTIPMALAYPTYLTLPPNPIFHNPLVLLCSFIIRSNLFQVSSLHEELVFVPRLAFLKEMAAGVLVKERDRVVHLDSTVVQHVDQFILLA